MIEAAHSRASRSAPRSPVRALAAFASFVVAGCGAPTPQPIAYNHEIHIQKVGLECYTCHAGSTDDEVAGLPSVSDCAACHGEMNGKTEEERKVVEAVAASREILWVRLYELPRHVYFSHRRHVAVAAIHCERCHGEMARRTRPPAHALVALTMTDCIDCHREMGARNDCSVCHR